VGLLGPGLANWTAGRGFLAGDASAWSATPTVLPPPQRLPPAERRRAGAAIKLALAVADEAVLHAAVDLSQLQTVFTSSSGDGQNCHALCEALATPAPVVSPTRFTNSVHNAASGCWHIAVGSRAASTSLCAFDGSFGAGLLEAMVLVQSSGLPALLVASDSPYPEPLHGKRPLPDHFGAALLLSATAGPRTLAACTLDLLPGPAVATQCDSPALDALRRAVPAAECLPLLQAIARGTSTGTGESAVTIDYLPGCAIRLEVECLVPAA
jgi:hypothetical protein